MTTRYEAVGIQAEFEPGSRDRVLRNLLSITRVRDINLVESQALLLAQRQAVENYSEDHRFTGTDVCALHRLWLGPIYAWAGEYRTVNVSKGGLQFAHAPLIPDLMAELECGPLARNTPCLPSTDDALAVAMAEVHAELILVHPFREGNGRVSRLVALLMGLQAGLPPLDFSPLDGRGKERYFAGIRAALGRDYAPLADSFRRVIDRTWKRASSSVR